jgi:hypothetical protein
MSIQKQKRTEPEARPPELDEPCKATGYNDIPCTCGISSRVRKSIDDLIAQSSIGRGLANIRENGLDAELASLEEGFTRKRARSTRKKPPATRKKTPAKGIGPKARKKR